MKWVQFVIQWRDSRPRQLDANGRGTMSKRDPTNSRVELFAPFFRTGEGQIIGLATAREDLRDGQAVAAVARVFPDDRFPGVTVQPSRPTLRVHPNVILIGSANLFLNPRAFQVSGEAPLGVGKSRVGERIEAIDASCCYRFRGSDRRSLSNSVTGQVYYPHLVGKLVDYGVVRRLYSGTARNSIFLEGVHRLGTLGAVKVATNRVYLDEVWKKIRQISGFDPTLPLEILVRTTFEPRPDRSVYSIDRIAVEPLAVVYDRRLCFDLANGREWFDQLPWSLQIVARGNRKFTTADESDLATEPRLEMLADLQELDHRDRELCREAFTPRRTRVSKRLSSRARKGLIGRLGTRPDLFQLRIIDSSQERPSIPGSAPLPDKKLTALRRLGKKFLVHLILCRLLGGRFPYDDASIRRAFPEFHPKSRKSTRSGYFATQVRGKLRDGCQPLLGRVAQSPGYVEICCDKEAQTYELRLEKAVLVVKLRW